ncbi:phosphoribosylaminoimidazolesuccinocarboxamide synthase [Mobilicoccus caccae]|uniref:Phosphoribosylaminoimidazole-succinocarboxamide synthase n=1 Tax=Mobilicoccus caccae TaxID=1859295 RepID=A0ABQ6IJW0_9MICO|nr:phosphoribosylaminoimidazolesuccinocarboxamide synthase [Mobilicoccus caccae]GMA38213.1 phosphoribosylaminoimidazole-succinocarboxamide synthase [Mobilicoccus caccae]
MTTTPSDAPPIPGHAPIYSGKVRDLYAPLDANGDPREDVLLLVASDRISAYDHVLDSVIPDKGRVLTQLSLWWFEQFSSLVPNHIVSTDVPSEVEGRAVLVRRLPMLPVECIARAYLTGSGLAEYREVGSVCGVALPDGLTEASPLPETIFTPTTKAPMGQHDQPITYAQVEDLIGAELASKVAEMTTSILAHGNEIAAARGILVADTKVEFGVAGDELVLADEVLTPDSSRFWRAEDHVVGVPQKSYDKQYVRDWLTSAESGWDRTSGDAPPALPADVVAATRETYVAAYEAITGDTFR